MNRLHRSAMIAALVASLSIAALSSAGPASAAAVTFTDPSGDALLSNSQFGNGPISGRGDLTTGSVGVSGGEVQLAVRTSTLVGPSLWETFSMLTWSVDTDDDGVDNYRVLYRSSGGVPRADVYRSEGDSLALACYTTAGYDGPPTSLTTVGYWTRFPTSCLGASEFRVRVNLSMWYPPEPGGLVAPSSTDDAPDSGWILSTPPIGVLPSARFSSPLPATLLKTGTVLHWIRGGSATTVDLRARSATAARGFSGYSTPQSWQGRGGTSLAVSLSAGTTTCWSIRGRDINGAVSSWSAETCTTRASDDRALRTSPGWSRGRSLTAYMGTTTSTTRKGATLSARVTAHRVSLVAKTCPKCGKVAVFLGTRKIGTINLWAPTTRRSVVSLPAFQTRSGTLRVKVLSSGRLVRIDAFTASRV